MDNCYSTQCPKGKVLCNPGWNDPPNLMYSGQQTTPNRPRNFLNKRVAFPLSSNTPSSASTLPMNLPARPTSVSSVPPALLEPQDKEIQINSEETLEEVRSTLLQLLDNSSELGPKANDIKRRIAIMEETWSSGKLTPYVQLQIKKLAIALKEDKPSEADDIHKALMIDFVSMVGTWMPGVKQLIHHCIARSELLAMDKE